MTGRATPHVSERARLARPLNRLASILNLLNETKAQCYAMECGTGFVPDPVTVYEVRGFFKRRWYGGGLFDARENTCVRERFCMEAPVVGLDGRIR